MIISVHLPKTAGTSFMRSFKAQFGSAFRLDNYDLPINTPPYERNKAALKESVNIAENWKEQDVRCIHGHFLPLKYLLLGVKYDVKFITWMRNPVERILSHYHFWKNCYHRDLAPSLHRKVVEENWSLEKFCFSNELRNVYGQFLWGFPFEKFDFIGITEFFDEDLRCLSEGFLDNDLVVYKELVSERDCIRYQISNSLRRQIEAFHDLDMYLYRKAFEIRQNRMQSGKKNAQMFNRSWYASFRDIRHGRMSSTHRHYHRVKIPDRFI
jgi:hypothetical protein